ncbi:MAG: hypothetical protein ACYDAE_19630 [Steroidobacteraceae bacterium]
MSESLLQYVLENLQATKGHWAAVAEASGVPKRTIEKIAAGTTADPGVRKVERLAAYFRRRGAVKAAEASLGGSQSA